MLLKSDPFRWHQLTPSVRRLDLNEFALKVPRSRASAVGTSVSCVRNFSKRSGHPRRHSPPLRLGGSLLEAKQVFLTLRAECSSTILRAVDKYQLDSAIAQLTAVLCLEEN